MDEAVEAKQKTCFVIMPISDVDGYEKGHFSRVYDYLIKPACEAAGYKVERADDTAKTNMIIVDILQKAVKYDMAICDISARNANVFYELGFRQAFNMKTVLIKDKKTSMPFDISSIRTVSYSETLRIDEVEKGRIDIQKALEETEKSDDVNSLISLLAIEKAVLPNSHKMTAETSMILNAINELNYKFNNINKSDWTILDGSKSISDVQRGDSVIIRGKERIYGKVMDELGDDCYMIRDNDGNTIVTSRRSLERVKSKGRV